MEAEIPGLHLLSALRNWPSGNPQYENRTKRKGLAGLHLVFFGAGRGIRTPDLLITNQLLCQLSYSGMSLSNQRIVGKPGSAVTLRRR